MTLTPKSPACILRSAMLGCTPELAAKDLNFVGGYSVAFYTAAAKAVRDAALDEAISQCGMDRSPADIEIALRAMKDAELGALPIPPDSSLALREEVTRLRARLKATTEWLEDEALTKWKYVESPEFYSDREIHVRLNRGALGASSAGWAEAGDDPHAVWRAMLTAAEADREVSRG